MPPFFFWGPWHLEQCDSRMGRMSFVKAAASSFPAAGRATGLVECEQAYGIRRSLLLLSGHDAPGIRPDLSPLRLGQPGRDPKMPALQGHDRPLRKADVPVHPRLRSRPRTDHLVLPGP